MNAGLILLFLTASSAESLEVLPTQSFFKSYDGYSVINAQTLTALSGLYESLLHCTLACTRSPDCTAIRYSDTTDPDGVMCYMLGFSGKSTSYLISRPDTIYMQDVLAVPYTGFAANLSEAGFDCDASSTLNSNSSCAKLCDGEVKTDAGTEWISSNEGSGGWVRLEWSKRIDVVAVSFWNRCRLVDQCSRLRVNLNDDNEIQIMQPCLDGDQWDDCSYRLQFLVLSHPTPTTSVNISCMEVCDSSATDITWGLQEIIMWEQFYA